MRVRGLRRRVGLAVACAVGALLSVAAVANAAVLHEQYDSFGGAAGIASADPPGANNATQLADDFVVPAGQIWTINGVDVRANFAPSSFNVFVYAGGANVPGALVTSRTGLAPTDTSPDLSVAVAAPIVLNPGIYWIGLQADQSGWGWVSRTVVTGFQTAWRTEQDGSPCEAGFKPFTACGLTSSPADAAFRLNGATRQIPAVPAKKKCKKKKRKSAASAKKKKKKKKCRKKKRRGE